MKNVPIPLKLSELIIGMPTDEAGRLLRRIMNYASGGQTESESPLAEGVFSLVKPAIDAAFIASEAHKNSGKSGGRPKKEPEVEPPKPEPEEKAKRFVPPTLDEVAAYCNARNNGINPQEFIDHYTANGWRQGRGAGRPVKDWQACVRTWENNRNSRPQYGPNGVLMKPKSEQLHDLDEFF